MGGTVDIRVENPYFGDAVDGKPVALGDLADGLGAGRVVDAERHAVVIAHVRVLPGDSLAGVGITDLGGDFPAFCTRREVEAVGKGPLDHVSGH
jgi:hypothetical protein